MKKLNPIAKCAIIAIILAVVGYLRYKHYIDSFHFWEIVIIAVLSSLMWIIYQRRSSNRKQAHTVLDAVGKYGGLSGHESHRVKSHPTLAGLCCDFLTVVALIVAWYFIVSRNLLENDTRHASLVMILFTLIALISILQSYLPMSYGGWHELLGPKQARQEVIRLHTFALASAMLVLSYTLMSIAPTSSTTQTMTLISIPAVIGLFVWKFFIKKVELTSKEIYQQLTDEENGANQE